MAARNPACGAVLWALARKRRQEVSALSAAVRATYPLPAPERATANQPGLRPLPAGRCPAQTCTEGTITPQGTCDAGTCAPASPIACAPYCCDGDACATTCATDNECAPDAFCNGNTAACETRREVGATCDDDDWCRSGACCASVCQDCCNNADCSGPTPVCVEHICTACETHEQCGGDHLCVQGICHACDVTPALNNLQAAITGASAGETIYVCPGSYPDGATGVTINAAITIIGAGDGAGETSLSGPITISSVGTADQPVIMRDLRVVGSGSGVDVTSSHLRMERCTIRGGASETSGLRNQAGTVELRRCKIIGNHTSQDGGGISNVAGTVILRNCLIEGNSAPWGAGIFTGNLPQDSSALELYNTEVRGNTASGNDPYGAEIYNDRASSTVTIANNSIICGNTPAVDQCNGIAQDACFTTCPG
jgi:hypothetical protein